MKFTKVCFIALICALVLCSCQTKSPSQDQKALLENAREILLSDEKITLDGANVGSSESGAVYIAKDIVYYETGKDFTYGEGSEKDAHEKSEADAHTVLHIAEAGSYRIKGTLSLGQIAVDLGKDAKEDPNAVVTLILDGVDITCTVAPAVIFYNVYECGSTDANKASKDVDTSKAGANVILADNSKNTVKGSYVERIYKPDSVVLNDEKNEVKDAKKLHKYDGAFYSKTSMNVSGEKDGSGILNIYAENEGLDSELHLTINGGEINIQSGNDGINTNEDGISVTTVNGGKLNIKVTGETGEGDGIDSNGWLVINGGEVKAQACSKSGDSGIDSDMGIHINGGTVTASGNMLDRIEDGGQTYAVFHFSEKQKGGETVKLKNKNGNTVCEAKVENAYSILILSSADLTPDTYTLWSDNVQLEGQSGAMGGGMGPGGKPDLPNQGAPIPPQDQNKDKNFDKGPGFGNRPEPPVMPERVTQDSGIEGKEPNGFTPKKEFPAEDNTPPLSAEVSKEFVIREGGNTFAAVAPEA